MRDIFLHVYVTLDPRNPKYTAINGARFRRSDAPSNNTSRDLFGENAFAITSRPM